jgi:hypothetical protein
MRRIVPILMTTVLVCVIAFSSGTALGSTGDKIEGHWELVSGPNVPPGWKEIKMITGGHFVWVMYEAQKKKNAYTGGGTYKLDGDHYTEHLDFMTVPGADSLIDKDQPFTFKLDGNSLVITGTLSDGEKMTETWKRTE